MTPACRVAVVYASTMLAALGLAAVLAPDSAVAVHRALSNALLGASVAQLAWALLLPRHA